MSSDSTASSEPTPLAVADRHLRELGGGSGISEDVIKARGYETVTDPARLASLGFSKRQQRSADGLLIPMYGPSGDVVTHQFKPDKPRKNPDNGKTIKYESPKGSTVHIDVPPGASASLPEASVPLWVTEGVKKADAAVTAGLCCVALQGVDCWRVDDWDHIALQGRQVFRVKPSHGVWAAERHSPKKYGGRSVPIPEPEPVAPTVGV